MNTHLPIFISEQQLTKRYAISRSTVNRWRRHPTMKFPQPKKFGPNTIRYCIAELEYWFSKREDA